MNQNTPTSQIQGEVAKYSEEQRKKQQELLDKRELQLQLKEHYHNDEKERQEREKLEQEIEVFNGNKNLIDILKSDN